MGSLLITVITLGLIGLDPVGALIGITAMATGSKRRTVILYGLAVLMTTIATGTVISLTSATFLADFDWTLSWIPDTHGAIIQVILGLALLVYGIHRWQNRNKAEDEKSERRSGGALILIGTGLLFGVTAPIDPTFVGLSVVAGNTENLLAILVAHTGWILISQLPLVVWLVAVMMNRHQKVMVKIQSSWARVRPYVAHSITGLVSAAGALLLVEIGWWLSFGSWFPFWS